MKIIVNGAGGHMGKIMSQIIITGKDGAELAAQADPCFESVPAQGMYRSIAEYSGDADAVIDFSFHTGAKELLDYCTERKLPVVVATTGHTADELKYIEDAAEHIAVFRSANMSLGIAVLSDIAKAAAAAFPDADIEIVETHHNRKIDVPSGTALLLAGELKSVRPGAVFNIGRPDNGKRKPEEIGIHSLRIGNEVGTHEIMISTANETIRLSHQARDRALFADGALKAAFFIKDRPAGMYSMRDLIAEAGQASLRDI